MPACSLLPKPPRNDAEHRLQCALMGHMQAVGVRKVFCFAVPNGGHRNIRTAARLKAEGVKAGVPDIVLIVDGRAHGLELKVKGNRQSPAQKAVQAAWELAGGRYAVATGIDEALAVLRAWGALRADYSYVPAKRLQRSLPIDEMAEDML